MDQTKRPLLIPPSFAVYAEKHGLYDLFKQMMEQLLISHPDDPIAFLIDLLTKDTFEVPHIMVLGPPAAGKHSISKMVAAKLRCPHLTTMNLMEEVDLKIRDRVEECLQEKKPVPTELWVAVMKDRMQMFDCVKKGWLLEGFPKTREQALALQAVGISPKHCVVLEAPDTVLIERAAGKRVDPETDDVYHTTFEWPSNPGIQDRLVEGPGQSEAEMVEKLVEYHRNSDAIARCFATTMKVINADQPKADVYSQTLAFLQTKARSNAPFAPRILLLGPTGSGKKVQASQLAQKYNIVKVSCGQLVKQAIVQETPAGMIAKSFADRGMMIPDGTVLNLMKGRLCQLDCQIRGWVLTGYPKTRAQAEELDMAGLAPNRVFFLEVPNDSVIERLTQRAVDPVTGDHYHMLYNPPCTQEVKRRLERHPQDAEMKVRRRLDEYHAYVEELADYYKDALHIIADQDPHTVFECIESMTVLPLPKHF